ncbi:MAG: holo-ACP synthase [Propionicimonas sp.]|nr:holo-ACP synthase [Propionicimonas sp.]
MNLRGVGVDLADAGRLRRLLDAHGERFAHRWFAGPEVAECESEPVPAVAYACRFAAKEAVWKALAVPWDGSLPWRWIVVAAAAGTPEVELRGRVADAARLAGVTSVRVSWSSSGDLATAVALAYTG